MTLSPQLLKILRLPVFHPLLLAGLAMLAVILSQASLMEDGYITFRVLDNFVNGEGLRWNLHERVQVYTNPLWLFVHVPLYAVFRNIFIVTLIMALLCTEAALFFAVSSFRKSNLAIVCLFMVPLMCSRTFAVYSTSGFENVLGHLMFAGFGYALIKRPAKFWLWLSLCTSLSMVNRLDTVVFYIPVWGYLLATRYPQVKWRELIMGGLPIAAWEIFSLFYYGFLFPNTKYAKLNTGVDNAQYLELGYSYLLNLVATDFVSALLIIAVVATLPFLAWRYCRTRDDNAGLMASLAAGVLLYCFYVYLIGGTYLSGRLLSLQVFASAWLLLALFPTVLRERNMVVLAVALVAIKLFYPPLASIQELCPACFRGVDPITSEVKDTLIDYVEGKALIPEAESLKLPEDVHVEWSMGKWGWSLERRVKVIDGFAIVDPLLARLPMASTHIVTMGMTTRAIPEGYVEYMRTGDMSKMDPDLAQYYSKLHFIISGDLWDPARVLEIIKFNLGAYDYLRDQYVQKMREKKN